MPLLYRPFTGCLAAARIIARGRNKRQAKEVAMRSLYVRSVSLVILLAAAAAFLADYRVIWGQ
jgi:hypothetical protein